MTEVKREELTGAPPTYRLLTYPNKILITPCKMVDDSSWDQIPIIDSALRSILARHRGVGLAAPQVGVSLRIFIAAIAGNIETFINPAILTADTFTNSIEGCLSIPGLTVTKRRYDNIQLNWYDVDRSHQTGWFRGYSAFIIQHELDHLDGVLINKRHKK